MTEHNLLINRAPVLTLWATIVAERLGFDEDEALSLGKAVAGLTAQSKGQRLGIYKPVPQEVKKARARKRGEEFLIEICGRQVPVINTQNGIRAVVKNQPVESKSVERYLDSKFGESLDTARRWVTSRKPSDRSSLRRTHSGSMSSSGRPFQKG